MINQYVIVGDIGKGSYAKVKLGFRRVNGKEKFFAIKIFKKSFLRRKRKLIKDPNGSYFSLLIIELMYKDFLYKVAREVAVMKKINHPNIIKLYEVLDNPEADKIYLSYIRDFIQFWSMLMKGIYWIGIMIGRYFGLKGKLKVKD